MKIQYTQFAPNPSLRGTITNLPAHVAQVLIAQGVAVHVPYKDFRERLAAEFSPLAKPPVVEWGVQEPKGNYSRVAVVKRVGSETMFFAAPPPDCPPAIVAQYKALTDGTVQEMSPDEAAMLAEAGFVGDSNKHRPVCIDKDKEGKPVYVNPLEFVARK